MPYVKWMKGEQELTKEEEMPIGRNVLELTNIRQSANYTCVAISSLGMIDTTAQITVKGKRRLASGSTSSSLHKGQMYWSKHFNLLFRNNYFQI